MQKTQFARDLKEKDIISSPFLIKFSAVAMGKNGKAYMNLVFMDRSGEVEARIWDGVQEYAGQAVKDAFVQVEGKCQAYQGRRQIVVSKLQILREDEVELKDYIPEGTLDPEEIYGKLKAQIASMQDPHYRALAESVLIDDEEIVGKLKRAPAAKSVHHAYKTGLLEHVVSVVGLLDAISKHYGPIVDRDLLFIGGFFHDICKIWELSYDRVTDYTDEGRFIGHLVMGVELITAKVALLEAQPGRLPSPFPKEKILLAKHVLLAHHGKLEYGSPKEPHCLEAVIVHYLDDLDSKVNAIQKFVEADQTPGQWTGINRMYNRYFYKKAPVESP